MHDDGRWVDIAEAARRLGVSVVTVRRRIKQGALEGELQNGRRGPEYRVRLPPEGKVTNLVPIHEPIHDDDQEAVEPTHLIIELIRLQERHQGELAEMRADLTATHAALLGEVRAAAEWRTRAELLERQMAELRAELERARRPWWRRLFG